MPKVVIIGGGISGLSAAYYLAKGGCDAAIIESRGRLGGLIHTERVEGCTLEAGPDSFLSSKPAAMELIRELGLADEVIGSNDHLRITYVRKGGRLVPLPDGLMMMVPTRIVPLLTTPLLSLGTKLRMGMELLRRPRRQPAGPGALADDESVAQFVEDHYGVEAVDYLAEPLLSGIYGGHPAELSVASVLPRFVELSAQYGSLTRGVLAERAKARSAGPAGSRRGGERPEGGGPQPGEGRNGGRNGAAPAPLFRTLKGGLGQMVDAVARAIAGKTEVRAGRAEAVERAGAGFRIRLGSDWMHADQLVMACEAHSASALLGAVDARLSELLGSVPYSSAMAVALGFDAADLARPRGARPEGFGFLVPKKERRRLVACTWVGTKFAHRVPADKMVARCFLGGTGDPGALELSDEAIVAIVTQELQEITGITARPRFSRISRCPRSMAQYTVGHARRVAEMEERASQIAGLHLAGNAYQGIGIPDCIRMGKQAAERILRV